MPKPVWAVAALLVGVAIAWEGHRRKKVLGPTDVTVDAAGRSELQKANLMQLGGLAAAGGALFFLAG